MRYVRICLVLAIASLGLVVFGHGQPVHAETGGYPYADKPCVWAPYQADIEVPFWCKDYDWGSRHNDLSAANVLSPYGYYYRNCTDYTAWRVAAQNVPADLYKGLGNAKDWGAKAAKKGIRVDSTPAPGSVAVRTSGQYGHTAYVESTEGDNIVVSHYNYAADGSYSEAAGTPQSFGFTAFVHFEDYYPPPDTPEPVSDLTVAEAEPETAAQESAVEPASIDAEQAAGLLSDESEDGSSLLQDEISETAEISTEPSAVLAEDEVVEVPVQPVANLAPDELLATLQSPLVLRKSVNSPPSRPVKYDELKQLSARKTVDPAAETDYWPMAGLAITMIVGQLLPRRPDT